MVDDATLRAALSRTLDRTDFDALGSKYEGKVRDNYSATSSRAHQRDGRRFIVVTDRISAFDRVLGTIPFKGQVLNRQNAR
jgi:phosphoribosylaminoimidazole-succinocarboxamide synthase